MNVLMKPLEAHSRINELEIAKAQTLQDLLDWSADFCGRHDLSHAVLYGPPVRDQFLALALMANHHSVSEALAIATNNRVHPAQNADRMTEAVCVVGEHRAESNSKPLAELINAFRSAGFGRIYHVPLVDRYGTSFVLEVGCINGALDDQQLRELGAAAALMAGRLPRFMCSSPSHQANAPAEYEVC